MEMSKAELLLRLGIASAGYGLGAASTAGRVLSGALGSATGSNDENDFVASKYPHPMHTVDVKYFPGETQLNRLLQRGISGRAAKMQTLEQHNEALTKYLKRLPATATPRMKHDAIMRGIAEEQSLLEYWDDKKPRREYTPSSSVAEAIRITPDNRVEVKFGSNGKWYTYQKHPTPLDAANEAAKLINSGSIGRALCRKSKKYGGWAKNNYDRSMATE